MKHLIGLRKSLLIFLFGSLLVVMQTAVYSSNQLVSADLIDVARFHPFETWSSGFNNRLGWDDASYYWATIQFPDVDGDGRSDVCGRDDDGIYCGLSTGSTFTLAGGFLNDFTDQQGWHSHDSYWATIQFPDVNGDGKADIIYLPLIVK